MLKKYENNFLLRNILDRLSRNEFEEEASVFYDLINTGFSINRIKSFLQENELYTQSIFCNFGKPKYIYYNKYLDIDLVDMVIIEENFIQLNIVFVFLLPIDTEWKQEAQNKDDIFINTFKTIKRIKSILAEGELNYDTLRFVPADIADKIDYSFSKFNIYYGKDSKYDFDRNIDGVSLQGLNTYNDLYKNGISGYKNYTHRMYFDKILNELYSL